jgi:hypothetical protein
MIPVKNFDLNERKEEAGLFFFVKAFMKLK